MFPERLRALRRGKHLTLSALADELNKQFPTDDKHENTPSQIGNWERGVRTPSYVEVQKLASLFNVTMDYLTGLTENNTYDLGRMFISDKSLQFNGQSLVQPTVMKFTSSSPVTFTVRPAAPRPLPQEFNRKSWI